MIKIIKGKGQSKGKSPGQDKDLEKRLRELELEQSRLRRLIASSPAMICQLDSEGKILLANQAFQSLSGYSEKELARGNFWEIFFPGELGPQAKKLAETFARGEDVKMYQAVLRSKSGAEVSIFLSSANLREGDKTREINLFGHLYPAGKAEVVDPEQIQRKSEQARGAYERMAGIESVWIYVTDEQGNVLFWNKGAEQMSGYASEQVLGSNKIHELLYPDPDYLQEVVGKSLEIISKSKRETLETTITTRQGGKKTISWNSVGLKDSEGRQFGHLVMGIDITERKKLEEQDRLAQKMDGLTRLAAGVAHDFNNLLGLVQGYVELTLEVMDYNDPLRENLLEIADASERGAKLTNQLLAFSKHQIIEPISYDLNQSIRELSRTFKRVLGDEVNLELELAEELPPVKADPSHIEQCLVKLVMNAKEAIGKFGTLAIRTSAAKIGETYIMAPGMVKQGDYVLVSVSDTGKGMSREVKDRLFEPFFSTKEKASGLGLATVYGVIHQHGGYILVDSEPERGATFNVYLPISALPAEKPRQKESKLEMPSGNESILLVEDDVHLLALSARILRRLGYTVFEAENPKDALLILDKYPEQIHLLLTDVIMPKMNGIELSRRALEQRKNLKVLFVTGHPLSHLEDPMPPGCEGNLLIKPFPSRVLAQKVREILDRN